MYVAEAFAKFIVNTKYEDLPQEVVSLAKERILDTVGAMIAGENTWESKTDFLKACDAMGAGGVSIFGDSDKKYPLARACMINSTFAHAVELDDGHSNAGCHAGAVIVPTALTIGRELEASGKDILNAIVLGYEVVYRTVEQMTPHQIKRGFHPSGNCDVFGAVAVAGKLMGLKEEQIANGLGFAGLFAAGLMEATVTGQQNKCIQVGNAALNGVTAAHYAAENLEGTLSVFEGKTGFFNAQSQDVDVERVVADLGKSYRIGDTYSKMYPTCRHSQAAIEAVLDLVDENNIESTDVDRVSVGTHSVAYDLTGKIIEPASAADAKFSMAYGVALALQGESIGICHLTPEYWENPATKELAHKFFCCVDESVQAYYPKKRGAKVTIRMTNGKEYVKELYELKGSPQNPVGWKELLRKFNSCVSGVMSPDEVNALADKISGFDQLEGIEGLSKLLKY